MNAPDPRGRARGEHVPRLQRHALRYNLNERGDVPDHQVRRAVLPKLPVDPRPYPQGGPLHVQLRRGDHPRTHGAEPVDALREEKLLVALLEVASGDVVDDGVAKHVIERPGWVGVWRGCEARACAL